jgi:hypothetical protein
MTTIGRFSGTAAQWGGRAALLAALSMATASCSSEVTDTDGVATPSSPAAATEATATAEQSPSTDVASLSPNERAESLSSSRAVPPDLAEVFASMDQIGVGAPEHHKQLIQTLRGKSNEVVAQLKTMYDAAPRDMFLGRWRVVNLAAALEAKESLAFLKAVAASPIDVAPDAPDHDQHEASPRAQEEMIRSRAIVGLSRLAQRGEHEAAESLVGLLNSNSREVVIAAALELDLLGKLGSEHHAALKANGLKTQFKRVAEETFHITPDQLKPADPNKLADPEPPALVGNE